MGTSKPPAPFIDPTAVARLGPVSTRTFDGIGYSWSAVTGATQPSVARAWAWILRRYRTRLLLRAIARFHEAFKYAFVRPERHQFFHVVSSERCAGEHSVRCLQSVYDQSYPRDRIRHVFVDDASTDATLEHVQRWLAHHPDHSVDLVVNDEPVGALRNHITGFSAAAPGDVVVELNGDDWLPDPGVLRFLDKVYADPDVWVTFNTYRQTDGTIPIALGPSRRLLESGKIRGAQWCTSQLRTFRRELFDHLSPEAFRDPTTGEYWKSSQDRVLFIPIVELAGTHARHIYRITYVYNLHDLNDEIVDPETQSAVAEAVRDLPPHRPLESL